MAIQWISGDTFTCVSTDTKPTLVPTDTKAIETNTDDLYRFNGTSWVLFSANDKIETLTNKTISGASNTFSAIPVNSLSNFAIASPVTNQLIQYNGINWVNATVSGAGGGPGAGNTSGYKYFIYLDSADNKFKAVNGKTGVIDYTSSDATDAQPVIHSAITANSNAPGKILLAGNTTFPVVTTIASPTRHLQLYSGQWLQGCGWSSKILGRAGLGVNAANIILSPRNATDIIVSDLCIDGQNFNGQQNTSANGGNLHCTSVDRLWIYNVKSINSPERGINANNCKYVNISHNYVEVTKLEGAPDFAGMAGIECVAASDGCIVANNVIKNAGGECIGTHSTTKKVQITGNVGIVTLDSPMTSEIGRGEILIETNTPDAPDSELIVANNNLTVNYFGIVIMGGTYHADIHDNVINSLNEPSNLANDYSGIRLSANGYNVKIHDNDLYNVKGHGIFIIGAVSMIDISNNSIRNVGAQATNTYDGISWSQTTNDCSIVRIQNNDIYDDRGGSKRMRDGVRVSIPPGKTLTGLVIGGNQVIGQTGLRTNIINSGTLTYDTIVNPYIIDSTWSSSSSTNYDIRYLSVASMLITTNEALVQATIPYNFRITRVIAKMSVNSVNANTIICLRDDGADVGSNITYLWLAGSTAEQDSGTLSTLVAAGSKINIKTNTTASSTGNWLFSHYTVYGYWE